MIVNDDRTEGQVRTHYLIVVGTDRFMSGWGRAEGGRSFAGWAFRPEDEREVVEWVERRSDMSRIRIVGNDYRPAGKGHLHIYVATETHPSLRRKYARLREMGG